MSNAAQPTTATGILALPKRLYDWMLSYADSPHATWALAVFAFAEASFFPIPPDVLLLPMCMEAPKKALKTAAVCSAASVLGGMAGYAIGAFVWGQVGGFFFEHIPGFTPERFEHMSTLYAEYDFWIVFTAGFTPIPFKLITISGGVAGISFAPFVAAAFFGRAGRFFLVAGLMIAFGPKMKDIIERHFNSLALLFTALLFGGFALLKWLL